MEIRVQDTLAAVPSTDWALVAAQAGLYSSYDWLRLVEQETPGSCRYLLASDGAGLAGALPVYLTAHDTNPYYQPPSVFRAARPGPDGRFCVAGSRSGYLNQLLLADRLTEAEQRATIAALLDELAALSKAEGQRHSFLLYLNEQGLRQVCGYAENVAPVLSYSGDARLDAPGRCFDDYLASVSPSRRDTIGKEIRRFARQGLTTVRARPRDQLDLITRFALLCNEKYEVEENETELRGRFERQCDVLGDNGVLFICQRGTVPVGMVLAYRWGDRLYLRASGFDHAAAAGGYPYFNVVIYEPLRYCYETGLRGLHLGTGSHDAKAKRGARIGPLGAVALPADASAADPAAPTARSGVRRYWKQQFASMPQLFDQDLWRPWLGG
ncbi:MAG TPA: GNAT family N-acetyltransferase [Pseudonocardiaceae bacterium]|nr:GNAT family N-acetyltransferase [Pseudonocardiaceae bacterium]